MPIVIADTSRIDEDIQALNDEAAPIRALIAPINEKIHAKKQERETILIDAIKQLTPQDLDTDEGFLAAANQGWTIHREVDRHIINITREWVKGKSSFLNGGGTWSILKNADGTDSQEMIPGFSIQIGKDEPGAAALDELADALAFIAPKLELASKGLEWSIRIVDRNSEGYGSYRLLIKDGEATVDAKRGWFKNGSLFTGSIRQAVDYIIEFL